MSIFVIKKIGGSAAVSITPQTGETIDGLTSDSLVDKESMIIQSDGSNWWIIAAY